MVHFYRGKAEITACTKGDINSNKRQEFYFATYHKGETRIYMQYSFRGKKLLFRKKGVGKITALALSDFDNNGKKELAVAFRKNRTAAIYVSKNPNKLMADEKQKIYEKKNTVITAIASIKY
jgi:hypothetical protein